MNFEKDLHFSNVAKNVKKKIQIFGKDFSVKNSTKKRKKNVFWKKKCFFDFFQFLFFFMENKQIGSKTELTYENDGFTSYYNFGEEIT